MSIFFIDNTGDKQDMIDAIDRHHARQNSSASFKPALGQSSMTILLDDLDDALVNVRVTRLQFRGYVQKLVAVGQHERAKKDRSLVAGPHRPAVDRGPAPDRGISVRARLQDLEGVDRMKDPKGAAARMLVAVAKTRGEHGADESTPAENIAFAQAVALVAIADELTLLRRMLEDTRFYR